MKAKTIPMRVSAALLSLVLLTSLLTRLDIAG